MAAKRSSTKQSEAKSDPAVSYDEFKEHEGQRYTGMCRSHKWYYDRGEWKEKKITFLRSVLADLEKQNDREEALTGARVATKRAAARRRAHSVSTRPYARRASRVRASGRSRLSQAR